MPDSSLGNATSRKSVESPTQEVLDKLVLLLVSGLARSAIDEAAGKLGLSGESATAAIAEAKTRILIAARWDRNEQLGMALVRLNDIYRRALAVQDAKTALAAQKELNRLLDLYRPAASPKPTAVGRPSPDASASAELVKAREYLTPLGLGDDKTPLPELCRLVVLRVIEHGERKLSQTSRTSRRGAERTGSAGS